MENTQTPISERTDEQLVRTIAEWMGIDLSQARWSNPNTVSKYGYLEHAEHRWIFRPHADIPEGAADRERVMLAMPGTTLIQIFHHNTITGTRDYGCRIFEITTDSIEQRAYVLSHKLGRAICEAVVAWIEAQGEDAQR